MPCWEFLVGPVEKPRLPAALVPGRVLSQMAAGKQQPNMVLILLLAPVQLVILWFENTRDWERRHAHEHWMTH